MRLSPWPHPSFPRPLPTPSTTYSPLTPLTYISHLTSSFHIATDSSPQHGLLVSPALLRSYNLASPSVASIPHPCSHHPHLVAIFGARVLSEWGGAELPSAPRCTGHDVSTHARYPPPPLFGSGDLHWVRSWKKSKRGVEAPIVWIGKTGRDEGIFKRGASLSAMRG
jgi:hypothetical protein